MEYNIKWNGRTIDNTGRHHLRRSARRTRARRYLSCPEGLPGISFQQLPVCFTVAVSLKIFLFLSRTIVEDSNNNDNDCIR